MQALEDWIAPLGHTPKPSQQESDLIWVAYLGQVRENIKMISKKICLVGAFAVGKTSLVTRYVYSIFSDNYLSTIGVKISKKQLDYSGSTVTLVLWDLEGKDNFTSISTSYLRGASGVFIVADCTRRETLEEALTLRQEVVETVGNIPSYLLINKWDLPEESELTSEDLTALERAGIQYLMTSAKTGQNVDTAFQQLAHDMLRDKNNA